VTSDLFSASDTATTSTASPRDVSLVFLRQARRLLATTGHTIINVDATIELERPKLALFIPGMRKKLAAALGIKPEQVSVKAKTGEGLGAVGEGVAIRAGAIALLKTSAGS
jgi:2-C-methyl-D-erythritol 2,4-cyclodiphosphate synthase